MLTHDNIRTLLADTYREAALRQELDMQLVAEMLEHTRAKLLVTDPYSVFRTLGLNKDRFDKPGMKLLMVQLIIKFNELLLKHIGESVHSTAKTSLKEATGIWWSNYIESILNFLPAIYIPLVENKYPLEESTLAINTKLKEVNKLIFQGRWAETYWFFDQFSNDKRLSKLQQAYFHINTGKVELYYMAGYKEPLEQFGKAKQKAGDTPWITQAYAEYYIRKGEFETAREFLDDAMCNDDKEVENYLLMGDMYRDEKKPKLAEQWYFDAMKLNFIDPAPLVKLAITYTDPSYGDEKNERIKELIEEVDLLEGETTFTNGTYIAYRDLGNYSSANGNYRSADEYFQNAIKKNPDWLLAYVDYSHALISQERFEEADVQLQKALQVDPESFDTLYAQAWYYEKRRNFQQAIEHYKKCAELRPLLSDGLLNTIGVLYGEDNQFDLSKKYYQKAIEAAPGKSLYYSNLGYATRKLQQYKEAEAAYQKAIDLEQNIADYHNNLGNLYYELADWSKAKEAYKKAIEQNNLESVYHENLGLVSDHLKEFEVAKSAYETASVLRPCRENFNLLGIACYNLGRNLEAVELYRKALEFTSDEPVYHYNIGLAFTNEKKHAEAAEAFKVAVKLDPANYRYLNSLGGAYYELGETQLAIDNFKEAIIHNPHDPVLYENLGLAYEKAGDIDEAEKWFSEMLQRGKDDALFLNRMGIFHYRKQDFSKAIRYYQKAIESNSGIPVYHENLGLAYEEAGMFEEAKTAYRKLIELAPAVADYYFKLAFVYFKDGDKIKAVEIIDEGMVHAPANIELLKLQAQYQEQASLYNDALATYERALAIVPGDEYLSNRAGICCYMLGDNTSAVEYYQQALDANPAHATYYANLGLSHGELGNLEQSIAAYKEAVALDPTREHHNALGVAHYKNGDIDLSIYHYLQALELEQVDGLIYVNLALSYIRKGMFKEAEDPLIKALEIEPGNQSYQIQLGTLYAITERYEESYLLFNKGLDNGSTNDLLYDNLAYAFSSSSDPLTALLRYKDHITKHPEAESLRNTLETLEQEYRFSTTSSASEGK